MQLVCYPGGAWFQWVQYAGIAWLGIGFLSACYFLYVDGVQQKHEIHLALWGKTGTAKIETILVAAIFILLGPLPIYWSLPRKEY